MNDDIKESPDLPINADRQYIIGTSGHIDHGKTALVKALTGIDTDRLPEEKARGITIDLGFAHLSDNITIIDVPGHERLIKTMVAGVSSIDLMLLVVAADDGVMPQTREHIEIIRLLQIGHGVIAITKADLADEDWLTLVEEDIRGLLAGTPFESAPLVRTSAETGKGMDELRKKLMSSLAGIPPRQDHELFRLPVDRAFTVKGFGTVLTGTVPGGTLSEGDKLELQPSGTAVRVRGIQSHDAELKSVRIGYRAAINVAGVDSVQAARGMALAPPGLYQPVEVMNARLTLLPSSPLPLKSNQRIRLHVHTAEVFARVVIPSATQLQPGEGALVQLRLEEPLHTTFRDRFIIRQYSPQRTIGGGVVLQTNPVRYRKKYAELFTETLKRFESGEETALVLAAFDRLKCRALTVDKIKIATALERERLQKLLKEMTRRQQLFREPGKEAVYYSAEQLDVVIEAVERILDKFHVSYPGRPGLTEAELAGNLEKRFHSGIVRRALRAGVHLKRLAGAPSYRLRGFQPQLSTRDSAAFQQLKTLYAESALTPPTIKEAAARLDLPQRDFKELMVVFREENLLVAVADGLLFYRDALDGLTEKLKMFFAANPELSVPQFKELSGTTRKHAIPLLAYLDRLGITERDGDVRRKGEQI